MAQLTQHQLSTPGISSDLDSTLLQQIETYEYQVDGEVYPFSKWFARFSFVLQGEAQPLAEPLKTRLILDRLSRFEYNELRNLSATKNPEGLSQFEIVDLLKERFKERKSILRKWIDFFLTSGMKHHLSHRLLPLSTNKRPTSSCQLSQKTSCGFCCLCKSTRLLLANKQNKFVSGP